VGYRLTVNGHGTDETMNGPGALAGWQGQRTGHNPHQAFYGQAPGQLTPRVELAGAGPQVLFL
jgi:hypothetical protein